MVTRHDDINEDHAKWVSLLPTIDLMVTNPINYPVDQLEEALRLHSKFGNPSYYNYNKDLLTLVDAIGTLSNTKD